MKYVKVKCKCKKREISQNKHTRMKNGTVYICKNCNHKIKFKDEGLSLEEIEIKKLRKQNKKLKKQLKTFKK